MAGGVLLCTSSFTTAFIPYPATPMKMVVQMHSVQQIRTFVAPRTITFRVSRARRACHTRASQREDNKTPATAETGALTDEGPLAYVCCLYPLQFGSECCRHFPNVSRKLFELLHEFHFAFPFVHTVLHLASELAMCRLDRLPLFWHKASSTDLVTFKPWDIPIRCGTESGMVRSRDFRENGGNAKENAGG